MFKLIKWLFLIAIVAAIVLWFTGIEVGGKSLKDRYGDFKQTTLYKEGVKDIRVILGEALKALGEEVSGEVTDDERQELEKLIKQQMDTGSTTKPEGNKTWQQETLKPLPRKEPPQAPKPAQ